jgi:hypothetical protein
LTCYVISPFQSQPCSCAVADLVDPLRLLTPDEVPSANVIVEVIRNIDGAVLKVVLTLLGVRKKTGG